MQRWHETILSFCYITLNFLIMSAIIRRLGFARKRSHTKCRQLRINFFFFSNCNPILKLFIFKCTSKLRLAVRTTKCTFFSLVGLQSVRGNYVQMRERIFLTPKMWQHSAHEGASFFTTSCKIRWLDISCNFIEIEITEAMPDLADCGP